MDKPTAMVSDYVKEKGINLTKISKETGIAYSTLYDSLLNKNRDRNLRGGELIAICSFLGLNPMELTKGAS